MVFTLEQAHYGGSGSSGVGACPLLGGSVSTGLWLQGYGALDLVPEHWHRGPGPGSPGGQSCFLLAVGLRGFKAACLWWVDPCPCPVSGSLKGISYVTCLKPSS